LAAADNVHRLAREILGTSHYGIAQSIVAIAPSRNMTDQVPLGYILDTDYDVAVRHAQKIGQLLSRAKMWHCLFAAASN
jgi:hypothetical protein